MKSFIPHFRVETPRTLAAALDLLRSGYRPLAGGTDVMVLLEAGNLPHTRYAALWELNELRGIHEGPDGAISIGPLTTYTELRQSAVINQRYPLLAQSAAATGGIANQNRGTLAGNIANASPAGDSLPVLLVYDAQLELMSAEHGGRWVPYVDFHAGYKRMDLRPGELITRIHLPPGKETWRQYFRKVGARAAQAISKVTIAAAAQLDERGRIAAFRLAYASVAPVPLRCCRTEQALTGADPAAPPANLPDETSPIDDIRSTARYRRTVARNLLLRFLASLAQ